jgi:hypothetical protein
MVRAMESPQILSEIVGHADDGEAPPKRNPIEHVPHARQNQRNKLEAKA